MVRKVNTVYKLAPSNPISPGCTNDQRYNGEQLSSVEARKLYGCHHICTSCAGSFYWHFHFHNSTITLSHFHTFTLSGEWKPASYVAVTTFAILALALAFATAYDIFNRVVVINSTVIMMMNTVIIWKSKNEIYNWEWLMISWRRVPWRRFYIIPFEFDWKLFLK